VTKNAIIGLVHRMGLPSRVNPVIRLLYGPPRPPSVRRTVVRDGVKRKIRIPSPDNTLSALPSLQRAAPIIPPKGERVVRVPQDKPNVGRVEPCCFPIGEPGTKGFRYCDDPSEPGRPYCAAHMKVAYIRTPRISMAGLVA
jgi:GcrA cell cycle regulator